jgi:hypothetical protein
MKLSRLRRLAVLTGALLLGACSSFEREWKEAVARPAPVVAGRPDRFAGAWDGQWTSERHRLPSGEASGGRLRCIFTRVDDAHYRAKFYADWLIFSSGYETTFLTEQRGDVLNFRGEHDLGAIFGGVYRYTGRVTPQRFQADFVSKNDQGRFEMSRPAR